MLEIGNGGMTTNEYQIHMSLWAILAAPLLAGNDLTKMSEDTKSILLNKEVIAIDQDSLGKQGDRLWSEGSIEIWSRKLSDGSTALGVFNLADTKAVTSIHLNDLGITGLVKARDLWLHKNLDTIDANYKTTLAPHSVLFLRISS
jgi:alpha-galactosidase